MSAFIIAPVMPGYLVAAAILKQDVNLEYDSTKGDLYKKCIDDEPNLTTLNEVPSRPKKAAKSGLRAGVALLCRKIARSKKNTLTATEQDSVQLRKQPKQGFRARIKSLAKKIVRPKRLDSATVIEVLEDTPTLSLANDDSELDQDHEDDSAEVLKDRPAISTTNEIPELSEDHDQDSQPWEDWEYPPLKLNYDALKHIASCFLDHGECTAITHIGRGAFHEIKKLVFADGFFCIGRFTRDPNEPLNVMESATATADFIRKHTSIPVPTTYFIETNPNNPVGASFVLMEILPGKPLYRIWDELKPFQKIDVIEQIANVVAELMAPEFKQIGSPSPGRESGPLQVSGYGNSNETHGPFANLAEWASSFVQSRDGDSEELVNALAESERIIHNFLQQQAENPLLNGPYHLCHGDFDKQNMLFTWNDPEESPQLSGIIDWDNSFSGPLYQLIDYPNFLFDNDESEETRRLWTENSALRMHFVYKLSRHFSADSQERHNVLECFRQKSFTMNAFQNMFTKRYETDPQRRLMGAKHYVAGHDPESLMYEHAKPYGGNLGKWGDREMDSDDEEDSDEDEDEGSEEDLDEE